MESTGRENFRCHATAGGYSAAVEDNNECHYYGACSKVISHGEGNRSQHQELPTVESWWNDSSQPESLVDVDNGESLHYSPVTAIHGHGASDSGKGESKYSTLSKTSDSSPEGLDIYHAGASSPCMLDKTALPLLAPQRQSNSSPECIVISDSTSSDENTSVGNISQPCSDGDEKEDQENSLSFDHLWSDSSHKRLDVYTDYTGASSPHMVMDNTDHLDKPTDMQTALPPLSNSFQECVVISDVSEEQEDTSVWDVCKPSSDDGADNQDQKKSTSSDYNYVQDGVSTVQDWLDNLPDTQEDGQETLSQHNGYINDSVTASTSFLDDPDVNMTPDRPEPEEESVSSPPKSYNPSPLSVGRPPSSSDSTSGVHVNLAPEGITRLSKNGSSGGMACSNRGGGGGGVKRKAHPHPCQLAEDLPTSKNRKCLQADPSVSPRPFHSNLRNFVEGVLEESQWEDSLSCIASSMSTEFYPPPEILHRIMMKALECDDLTISGMAVHTLNQVLCLHRPASHKSLRKLYLNAMAPSDGGKRPWEFLASVIRKALNGSQVSEEAPGNQSEQSIKVAMGTAEQLLHFLVAVIEDNFLATSSRRANNDDPCISILTEVLWTPLTEKFSPKVPGNLMQLLGFFVDAVKMAAMCQDQMSVADLIGTLVQRAAKVSSKLGEMRSASNPTKPRDKSRGAFVEKLASIAKNNDVPKSKACLETFLSLLKPSWVCQGVAESFLQSYSDQLVEESSAFWATQPLTLKKIVCYYFYFAPHPVRSTSEERMTEANLPTKAINQQSERSQSTPKKNMNVKRKNMKGETPLHRACINNDIEKVRQLLTFPDIDINAQDYAGWTPLHEACNYGHIECVQELLNFHPDRMLASGSKTSVPVLDLYVCPSCGTTVLHDAVGNNHVDVVKLLVVAGGQRLVSMKNSEGKTVWDFSLTNEMKIALKGRRPSVPDQENGADTQDEQMDPRPTPPKPCSQDTGRSQATPKKNMNVKRRNMKGETPLHVACIKNDVDRVRQLLAFPDIDVNAQDNVGWTPLHEACNHGNTQCVQELLNFHPDRMLASGSKTSVPVLDLYIYPPCGTTVLLDAVENNHVDVVKLLVAAGGQRLVSMKNSEGKTVWDFPLTDEMKSALEGLQTSSHNQENEEALAHLAPDCEIPGVVQPAPDCWRPESENHSSLLPHPSRYRLFLRTPGDSNSGSVPHEELEKFVVTLMVLLQSYIKTHDLLRVQGEVGLTMGQPQMGKNEAPFLAAGRSPSSATASLGQPSSRQHTAFTDSTSSHDTLQEDNEVYSDLSRYVDGLKAHLRQLGLGMDTPKAGPSTGVDRSTHLISHLCSIIDFYAL